MSSRKIVFLRKLKDMDLIGNIFWLILGGLVCAIMYFVAGLVLCITIIGIPFGLQLMKLGTLALAPFGRKVEFKSDAGCLSIGFSAIWIFFGWWEIAAVHLLCSIICAITIVGLPLAKAHWRLMKLGFMPFALQIESKYD